MNTMRRKLNSQSGASIVIALIFFLLCLTVGAVVLTAATANVGRVTRIQNQQQAYFAVRSAAELLRDEIQGKHFSAQHERWKGSDYSSNPEGVKPASYDRNEGPKQKNDFTEKTEPLTTLMENIHTDAACWFDKQAGWPTSDTIETHNLTVDAGEDLKKVTVSWEIDKNYVLTIQLDTEKDEKYHSPMTLTVPAKVNPDSGERTVRWTTQSTKTVDGQTQTITHHHSTQIEYWKTDVTWQTGTVTKGGAPIVS